MTRKHRFAIVVSHPIQHFIHYYRALAQCEEIAVKVFFCSRIGLDAYFDCEMNTSIAWKMDLVGGYNHVFLPGAERIKSTGFWQVDNPAVGAALDEFRPDVVLVYGYSQMTALRTVRWCRQRGVAVMMTSDSELLQVRASWRQAVKSATLPRLLDMFFAFLTTGDNNEVYYRHYGIRTDRFFRVPFTIDEASYRDARTRRLDLRLAFRAKHGIGASDFVALTVGKVSERKRPQDIVAAARLLRDRSRGAGPIRFMMAGDGPLYGQLSAQTADEELPVVWLGFVNVDCLPEAYCAADVLLHPSEVDPHPLVCSEAACIGLPLLLSDRVGAVGMTDIARIFENTLIFSCGDAAAIAARLRALAADPSLLGRMGDASMRIFDELDARKSVDGTLTAIRYCLKPRKRLSPPAEQLHSRLTGDNRVTHGDQYE